MTHQAIKDLARRLERLEQGVTAQNVPQLAASSVEAGAIPHYDSAGQMTALVGEQHDGTTAAAVLAGPVPPAPADPLEHLTAPVLAAIDALTPTSPR